MSELLLERILGVSGFLVGMQCTILLLSAGYRLIDLGYALNQHWLNALKHIAIAIVMTIFFYMAGNHHFDSGLFVGQVSMVILHIAIFGAAKLIIWRLDQNHRRRRSL